MIESKVNQQASGIFQEAAAYIRKFGWQKEGMGAHGLPRCSMGALDSAYPKVEWNKTLAGLMYESLYKELNGLSLTQFNSKFQSGEKVARLYEQVALKLLNA
jgi:hypothetical protein